MRYREDCTDILLIYRIHEMFCWYIGGKSREIRTKHFFRRLSFAFNTFAQAAASHWQVTCIDFDISFCLTLANELDEQYSLRDNNVGNFLYVILWNNFISHINSFPVTLPVDVNVPLVLEQDYHVWSFYYSSQNNTVSYCTLLPCYIALLAWHLTHSLGQKLQRVKPWQTMLLWHLFCLFYMRISVSNVTLSVPCYGTRARVITFLPVFPWRVTFSIG